MFVINFVKIKVFFLCNITFSVFCTVPLKIFFVVSQFPHLSQLFVQDQIVQLINNGHDVKIHSFRFPKHEKMHSDVERYNLLNKVTYGLTLPCLNLFDIIYIQFGYDGEEVVKQAKKQGYKDPIFVCFRGNDLSGYLQKDPTRYDTLIKESITFLPVCSFFKNRLMQLGCEESKIVVHHSAIRTNDFKFKSRKINKDEKLHILTISRLTEKKGLEYTLRAIAILARKYPSLKYTIIGGVNSPSYEKRLHKIVSDLKLEKNVYFYGWATREEVKEALSRADIFILTSVKAKNGDQEGIPNVLKEAMAVGLPVIATEHAGNTELITHERTGLLVPEKDVGAIVHAVEWYIAHPTQTKKMAKRARVFIEQEFAIEPTVAKLEKLFEEALAEKRARI